MVRTDAPTARRAVLFLLIMVLTVVTSLTVAIAVETIAGLALRLLRKEAEPQEWQPVGRSKL